MCVPTVNAACGQRMTSVHGERPCSVIRWHVGRFWISLSQHVMARDTLSCTVRSFVIRLLDAAAWLLLIGSVPTGGC